MKVELLKWDSEFLGFKVGKLVLKEKSKLNSLNNCLRSAQENGFRLIFLYCTEELADSTALSDFQKRYHEKKITYFTCDLTVSSNCNLSQVCSCPELHLNQEVIELALESGRFSRFKLDLNFKNKTFERLYETWIKRSLKGEFDDEVFVVMDGKRLCGMITVKWNDEVAKIGLLAVFNKAQGRGIGTMLIEKIKHEACRKGIKCLEVSTQLNNNLANRFYQRKNFIVKEVVNIYHIWL